jgi:malate dehydrogenase
MVIRGKPPERSAELGVSKRAFSFTIHHSSLFLGGSMRKKITVVGAGNVGATTAHRLVDKQLADVVLIDILEGVPQGKGLDLLEAGPIEGYDVHIKGTNDYADTANSNLVVMTAGFPRKPGMSRDDLLKANYDVVKGTIEKIVNYSPDCILIVVTNPLDAMTQTAFRASGFSRNRVIGMAGVLDAARYRTFIAEALNVSVENVHGFVLGGHGDTMVPVPRYTSVAGIPVTELLPKEQLDAIITRTRNGGAEIVNFLKTGSAYYAPSAAIVEMVDAIFNDRKKILPCTAYLEGEYGIKGLFVGVPVKLGARGIEQILEIKLTPEEQAALQKSADAVKELTAVIGV